MKNRNYLLLFLLCCLLTDCTSMHKGRREESRKPATLRLMTYNIHNGIGTDGHTDYKRIARLITAVSPQAVALQELDSATTRSKGACVLCELARLTGMIPLYAPAIDYAGGKYGIAILCREKPLSVEQLPLPGREEARTLLVARFNDYIFMNAHLSLTADDALQSARLIVLEAQAARKPVFLGGDLNSLPSSPTMQVMGGQFQILTDTLWNSCDGSCIDYLCGYRPDGKPIEVKERHLIPDSTSSDHRPLYIDIQRP